MKEKGNIKREKNEKSKTNNGLFKAKVILVEVVVLFNP